MTSILISPFNHFCGCLMVCFSIWHWDAAPGQFY
jgi:hypothetical protein